MRGRSRIIKGELSISTAVRSPYSELVSEGSPAEISRTLNLCLFYFALLEVHPFFKQPIMLSHMPAFMYLHIDASGPTSVAQHQ
jgi:hypothetical protein